MVFLTRNRNEEFSLVLALLVQKQGHFNVQALGSHNHLQKRLKQLHKITMNLKTHFEGQDIQTIERSYPFDPVFRKLKETLGHQNGAIRQVSQDIIYAIYEQFGFEKLQSSPNAPDMQAL